MHSLDDLLAGRLRGTTRLDLSAQLETFPQAIFDLADSLEVLNLTGNRLTCLPPDLHRLHRLKVLFCSDNRFEELPRGLGACTTLHTIGFRGNRIAQIHDLPPGLHALILTDNQLTHMPESLGDCRQLRKLMLSANRLEALPERLQDCQQLELLRLASNQLRALPAWLWRMPKLAWLAYADNPLPDAYATPTPGDAAQAVPWSSLTLEAELGRGASGTVYRARCSTQTAPVAVKLYSGAVTSDGAPSSEMTACLAAGAHRHLVPVIGPVADPPEQRQALVMQRIPDHWRNLAGPPSLGSCTRDQYVEDPQLTWPATARLLAGIAAAAAHLHDRGLNHGDLYGHNVLFDDDGDCLLGDFGAASFYPAQRATPEPAAATSHADDLPGPERLEVRAFGILIEELLSLQPQPQTAQSTQSTLNALAERCTRSPVQHRPRFAEIAERLADLAQSSTDT